MCIFFVFDCLLYDFVYVLLIGCVWWYDGVYVGLSVVVVCGGEVFDIMCIVLIIVDLFDCFDVVVIVCIVVGELLGCVELLLQVVFDGMFGVMYLFVLCDVQVIKVCGVMFVVSLIECVIEEQVGGDLVRVCEVCDIIVVIIGIDLLKIVFGLEVVLCLKVEFECCGVWL